VYHRDVASEPDPLQPFGERAPPPPALRLPPLLVAAVALAIALGVLVGLWASAGASGPQRMLRAIFFASAFAYLVVSLLDFREHFRLERAATGRWWSTRVLPLGETLNHAATGLVVVAMLVLARPLPSPPQPRDWFVLAAPALFLALGWRDELVYHRRRCAHREDIMHTTAHLAAGVMMCSLLTSQLLLR
jgi:hypothetical protein